MGRAGIVRLAIDSLSLGCRVLRVVGFRVLVLGIRVFRILCMVSRVWGFYSSCKILVVPGTGSLGKARGCFCFKLLYWRVQSEL